MNRILTLAVAALTALSTPLQAQGEQPDYQIHRYDTTDGGILWNLSDNGQWGIVRLGTTSGGGDATPKLYDATTGEAFEVKYNGRIIDLCDVSDDGQIVVGSLQNHPVAYNRTTGQLTDFGLRPKWQWGELTSVTPDGRWAVGQYSGFTGLFDDEDEQLSGDFYFSPLMVNIETGDTLSLTGLPRLDMANLDQHAMVLNAVTPDGRYVVGQMDWYIMQPISGFTFIYDTHEHTYRVIGFEPDDNGPWEPLHPYLHHIEGGTLSPNGRYLAGLAYIAKPQEGSEFFNEYGVPFRYDLETSELTVFDNGESNNIGVGAVTDNGTIFGNPNSGSPLRNFRVFYKDRYWISFTQICQQAYGFNFQARTGYEYTGTVMAVSGDGSRFIAFPDPTCESYYFDLGRPIDEVCAGIDLLSNYTVSPMAGSEFAMVSTIEINFGRPVQILGDGNNVHLNKADGTNVYNGLSNGGLTLKTGSRTTVVAAFRPRPLEAGQQYELVIDAGAIAVSDDPELCNHEIRIPYTGRADAPVQLVKATPTDGSALRQIDNTSSYILLDFDTRIKATDTPLAYIERVEDGSRMATFNIAAGSTDATRHQLLLLPASTLYLYAGEDYRIVVEAGTVSDYSGNANSYNQRIELLYHGTYVREVANASVMFADDFNDPNACLNTWLRFEGDHRSPSQTMQAWGFDADNNPWNFTLHDTEESADYFAGSHSMYQPAGQSDDWMITPQIAVPLDGRAVLEFDAQSYDPRKDDQLTVYVYEDRRVLSYLNSAIMQQIRTSAVLLDAIALDPGADPELTEGEWTHYTYSLSRWAGKDIYLAFVNQNDDQSAVFVDNVLVQREVNYSLAFSNRERVVAEDQMPIAGQLTVLCDETEGRTSLVLRDDEGNEIARTGWDYIPAKGQPVDFAFDRPLPLAIGTEVAFTIDIQIGQKTDVYHGSIMNLAFEPVKRVVLEEMTGSTCINCPLGIVAIEHCEQAFEDRFIPIGIHTYTGDNLGAGLMEYTNFLGLLAAPMARINRLPGAFSPMIRQSDEFYYRDIEGESLWYDVVSSELNRLTSADLQLEAQLTSDGRQIDFTTSLRYALDARNQQLSLFVVVLEDSIVGYQLNAFTSYQSETMADWCEGGLYAEYANYPYVHNHVARDVIGQTFSGTIGLFPSDLEGGVTYTAQLSSPCPAAVIDVNQLSAVAMLIDTQTGEVLNAAKAKVVTHATDAIQRIESDASALTGDTIRTLTGTLVGTSATEADGLQLPSGIYLIGSRKVLVR